MDNSTPSSVGSSSGSGQSYLSNKSRASTPNTSISSDTEEDYRTVVRDELGPIPEVTVEFMLENIAPNSNVDVQATMTKLKEANLLSISSRWRILDEPNDQSSDSGGMASFSRMKDIYNSVISHTQFHDGCSREPTLTFKHLRHSSPAPDRASKAGPVVCGALTAKKEIHTKHLNMPLPRDEDHNKRARSCASKLKWFNTACVWGYKAITSREDLNENVLDMVWSLDHIMQLDHRRRFIFGITVENEDTRIWFTCREALFVTQPFNSNTHAAQLVQLIASLAYATPTQLGYDPTMKLRWRDNGFHYDIECRTRKADGTERKVLYETRKVLSDTASELQGRATRVYLALALDQDGPPATNRLVVLKDAWIDADSSREGDTHEKLLDGASEEEKRMFLTVYQHGNVQIDNQDDSTRDLILNGQNIKVTNLHSGINGWRPASLSTEPVNHKTTTDAPEIRIFNLYTLKPTDYLGTSIWKTKLDFDLPPGEDKRQWIATVWEPDVHLPKVHYRIVFEDVGESLKKISRSGNATIRILQQVMLDITKALHYMAKKGYVHRDVSAGNILWFGSHAKLSDLEFAIEYGTGGSSDASTGTYKFMAGEVMAGEYSVEGRDPESLEDGDSEQNPHVPFIYNPVHDLESLWWVGAWCTMCFFAPPCDIIRPSPQDGPDNEDLAARHPVKYKYRDCNPRERRNLNVVRYFADQLFPPSEDYSADFRMEEIHHKKRFGNRLDGETSPLFFQAFTYCLDNMRQCISFAYREIHIELPRTDSSYFTDILCITAPEDLWYHDPTMEGTKMFIHDRALQVIGLSNKLAEAQDVNLWPIHSMEIYSSELAEHREKLCSEEHCYLCSDLDF